MLPPETRCLRDTGFLYLTKKCFVFLVSLWFQTFVFFVASLLCVNPNKTTKERATHYNRRHGKPSRRRRFRVGSNWSYAHRAIEQDHARHNATYTGEAGGSIKDRIGIAIIKE